MKIDHRRHTPQVVVPSHGNYYLWL